MPSRADIKWSQLKVGLLVLVALQALTVAIFAMTGEGGFFSHKITLAAYFEDAAGLRPGAYVNLQGVTIGNVESVELVPNPPDGKHPVQVVMRVATGHSRWLRTDSEVDLESYNPLGEPMVNIYAGTLQAPEAKDGTVLKARPSTGVNDILVSAHTVTENLDELEERFGKILDQVQNGQGSIGKLLNSSELYDHINAMALNMQVLSQKIQDGQGTLGQMVNNDAFYNKVNDTLDNLNHALDTVQNGQGSMAKLLNDPALYNNANDLLASLKTTSDTISHGDGILPQLLNDSPTSAKLTDTLTRLNEVITSLQTGQGTLSKLLNDPALYNNWSNMGAETRSLVEAIRTNPKKYLTIHLNIF